jgi:Xaa-Pro aminopeptidase
MRPEVLGSESAGDVQAHIRATKNDAWDAHTTREEAFLAKLKAVAPESEIRDLDPIIDTLRAVKSPREIALIREATRLAGLGIMEVMRDAEPGMYEYELQAAAQYVFTRRRVRQYFADRERAKHATRITTRTRRGWPTAT